jgi:hypothetical protein
MVCARKSNAAISASAYHPQVELDWIFSKEHNYTYTIQMESNKTAEPANVNDDDLANEKPIVSQPRDVHTVRLAGSV